MENQYCSQHFSPGSYEEGPHKYKSFPILNGHTPSLLVILVILSCSLHLPQICPPNQD